MSAWFSTFSLWSDNGGVMSLMITKSATSDAGCRLRAGNGLVWRWVSIVLALGCGLAPLGAQSKRPSWVLECDTRIPLHERGRVVGSTRIVAGTELEVLPPGREGIGKNQIRLRYMNEVFWFPTGAALKEILAKQNPVGTAPDKQVLDLHQLQIEQQAEARKRQNPLAVPEQELPPTFTTETVAMDLPADGITEVPEGFAWDRTLIIPGKFGFLKLPFIKQTKPGICVAAASINAVTHLHPEIRLRGSELFRLYNNRNGGASFDEASLGNLQLGVQCRITRTAGIPYPDLADRIRKSIDANLPVVAADARHALLIYGYDREAKKLFVWNQWGNGKIVNGMPKGTYLLKESDLPLEFRELLFVSKVRFKPLEEFQKSLEEKVGATEDLRVHPLPGRPFGGLEFYLPYSAPQRLKACLRAGRTVMIPQGDGVLCVLPDEVKTDDALLQCRHLPSGRPAQHTLSALTKWLMPTRGEFYSAMHAAKLPQRPSASAGGNSPPAVTAPNQGSTSSGVAD